MASEASPSHRQSQWHAEGDGGPVAVVLAAGKSTRMKSDTPKVLHELCGQPILAYVLDALEAADVRRIIVVVGYQAERVKEAFADRGGIEFALQEEQLGTGHAVKICGDQLADQKGPVVVIAGDQPMVRADLIRDMLRRFHDTQAKALIATAIVDDPTGLGRIIRDEAGEFVGVVEQKDATKEQSLIREINPSFYVFDGPLLFEALNAVKSQNAQKEYYLTDVPGILRSNGHRIVAEPLASETDMFGINHRRHLANAHALMQDRIHQRHLDAGVTIIDPRNTYIDARARIGADSVIHPFTVISGLVEIGSGCQIGPFAHIRSSTRLADRVVIGSFVEVVRCQMGPGSTARHLAYLGDATLGMDVNVGGGAITANFDGGKRSETAIGDRAAIGSGSILIAPVTVGNDATVGAGAVVPKGHNVPDKATVIGIPSRLLR